jgi:hypothetical protein
MTAIVSIETVLLVLLIVLVAGLLRSHAEILRRIGPTGGAPIPEPPRSPRGDELEPALLHGTTLDGDAVSLDFRSEAASPTLLAFLTSGCSTCAGFWETLGERRLPAGVQTLIVTHEADRERPAKLRSLAPAGVPVVMSSAAWEDYRVPGSPYFVLVHGTIRGEGAASTWKAVASLVSDAIEDAREAQVENRERSQIVDERLAAAGIGPEHPSLYPSDE